MIKTKEFRYLDPAEVEKIKEFMAARQISQNKLAAKLGVDPALISKVLKGQRAVTKDLESRFYNIGLII